MTEQVVEKEEKIKNVHLAEELSTRYLSYAMSTIVSRSLPDVRDGLKPVHRRLLYAMRQLHLDPKSGFKKCARVVGDVIGKYHPHGDSAVYGAMVRLAQDFSVRYPLVDGQGNFGNIDGDGAAAMRYTEARLTEFAMALMEGLNENAVDYVYCPYGFVYRNYRGDWRFQSDSLNVFLGKERVVPGLYCEKTQDGVLLMSRLNKDRVEQFFWVSYE